jgi:DnaJ-class molecular chaperone
MAEDPYTVLGLPRTASEDDIRRTFRRLAKELHPDVNAGPDSEERFKRVVSAHDLLSDADKRRRYDRGEIDANGEPIFTARGGMRGRGGRPFDDLGGLADVFTDVFRDRARGGAGGVGGTGGMGGLGGMGSGRGQDVRYTLDVDLLEAIRGARKRVTLPDGGMLDLTVPEGVTDGQVLRLKGKGGVGLEPGDALVEIKVRTHPVYKRVGDDVQFEVPIALDEAVLGAKIEVETPTGRVHLTVPKNTSSGQVFRLKGKGVRNATSGTTGDALIGVRIVLPPVIDDALSYFLSEWRLKNKYDPRA